MSLFLNIRKEGDAYWSRVYADYARTVIKQMKREDTEMLNRHFGTSTNGGCKSTFPARPDSLSSLSRSNQDKLQDQQSGRGEKKQRVATWTGEASGTK